MKNLRRYGRSPFNIAVIHGGPGAPGEMAPVARRLSQYAGVLEPLQTETTIEGQMEELKDVLENNGKLPFILIGFSWGAWLVFILTSQYPGLVRRLILIGSAPFEEKYAADIMKTRLSRLSDEERNEALSLIEILSGDATQDKNKSMSRFGELMSRADSYDLLPYDSEILPCQYDVYRSVWGEASKLRGSGELLKLGEKVQCPVVAIHGDYDPHPSEGVKEPLSRVLKDFRFILLEKCGHRPWLERDARERFYNILREEAGLSV